jgi:hypothetical protein
MKPAVTDMSLSAMTKALLDAAKTDGPNAAVRTKMWTGVAGALGGTAGVAGVTANTILQGGLGATKVASLGALFGGTLSVGLAATVLYLGHATTPAHPLQEGAQGGARDSSAAFMAGPASRPGSTVQAEPRVVGPTMPAIVPDPTVVPTATMTAESPSRAPAPPKVRSPHRGTKPVHEDPLAREASLVVQARSALTRSDPRAALYAIRMARAIPAHQLDPEELAVEEQALRSLGQSDQANGIVIQLRLQYPDSDLAR